MLTQRITAAFRALRRDGYFARQNWQCCQSCGCAAMPSGTERYAFYHAQDAERIRDAERRGDRPGVHLAWGGDGEVIARALRGAGLEVEWDGSPSQRLLAREPLPVVRDWLRL